MEAKTVAKPLVEEVIVRFGTPYVIHTDQGVQFESNLFQEVCRLLQIQKTRTTPYHPQSDGIVERNNRTILTMLSAFVNWDEHLPYISMAYRAAEHETTGNTPNCMMLGREVTIPLDIQY
jgi:transposase InsO family protein